MPVDESSLWNFFNLSYINKKIVCVKITKKNKKMRKNNTKIVKQKTKKYNILFTTIRKKWYNIFAVVTGIISYFNESLRDYINYNDLIVIFQWTNLHVV